ncbi:hypothetical protein C672_1856 [[Clostridium] bifermentans ATCC 638]|uniref:Uncharacterized protein n=1 Tax=Paraclostridium bifermentans ATCC 638 = DSM 14991 TaxID=1233171 RepID=T4VQE9_PARBF|nr:hypothetical protein [Paraclostridium bifermentans]EQK42912.1 hypothetical protein C672_1856 [[Clostridium] bifermentans ATCC 638] [Paraclostridium bifermentans ATCC 638 = DSM 14991]RIZ58041.1 hypothetical protein CHH45_13410 [Paraclostridium bifermentans]UAG16796.1 hypothetical protein KXZ80_08320 [Paraclostridium bifermentans]
MEGKIFKIMKSIGINAYYQECSEPINEYVIYSIYQEKDTEIADNVSQATVYYITMNYWYINENRYKQIKNTMKSNGFKYDGSRDRIGENHLGKTMDFVFKEWND